MSSMATLTNQECHMSKSLSAVRSAFAIFGLALAATSAQAIAITLPTTKLDAEAVFSFSDDAVSLFQLTGVSASALGNTKADGSDGWSFVMPVTEVTLNASIFPFKLTPVAGEASGSGLLIQKGTNFLSLANFTLDFKRNVMLADIASRTGTVMQYDLFSFKVTEGLHVSTNGGLSMAMTLNEMTLTAGAQNQFISGLKLKYFERMALPGLNFGSLDIDIAPGLRFNVSDKPLVAAVPEPSSWTMLAVGMLAIAAISRRRQQA